MSTQLAHDLDAKERTTDVQIGQNINFESMLLNQKTLEGLAKHGFKKPSPIQLQAIPMGRCGFDLIIKAKSGTGKTAVFGIICLEMINIEIHNVQTLILAPTREIAVQIQQVILDIGSGIEGLKVEYFIGGTSIEDDLIKLKNQCHIAVGAPGRIKHLIKNKALQVNFVRLFVLDEADKLMDGNYQNDINYIYNKLPGRKQLIAASATYPNELDLFLTKYMRSPTHITAENAMPVLLGLKQFVSVVKSHLNVIQQLNYRLEELNRVLKSIRFTQCIVFSNYQLRAESLSNYLNQLGWSATFVSAAQKQQERLNAVSQLKEFKCRVLTTTDLIARGIDAANVDLIINYEVPHDTETYLHRMGRAGRYGSNGICVSIVAEGKEVEKLQDILRGVGEGSEVEIMKFPKTEDVPEDFWRCDLSKFERFNYDKVETREIPSTSGIKAQNLDNLTLERVNLQETQDSLVTNPKIITPEQETSKNQDHFTPMEVNQNPDEENRNLNSEQQDDPENFPPTASSFTLVQKNPRKLKKLSKKDKKNQATKNNIESSTANLLTSNSHIPEETSKTNDSIQPSNPSKVTVTNSKYENEASINRENLTLNKNIALFNLTKFVVQNEEPINQDSIKSIDSLLNIIDQEDRMQQSEVDPNNFVYQMLNLKPKSKTLTEENVIEEIKMDESQPVTLESVKIGWQVVENTTREIPEKTYLKTPKRYCNCSEDLAMHAYLYATSKTTIHWTNYLCPKHSELDVKDAAPDAEEDGYFEDMIDDPPPFPNMAESVKPSEQLTFGNFDGYVSGYSAQAKRDYLTGYSKKPRSNLKSSTTKPNEKYQLQLRYCSDVLETYTPYISDVEQMDKWYDMWRENLNAVRNNIQQEIFAEEVLRKQTK